MEKLTIIDLFSGAGGLSEGFMQTNRFDFLAHVEWEEAMVNTLRTNLVKRWNYTEKEALRSVVHFDIQKTEELINGNWCQETKEIYGKCNDLDISHYGLDGTIGDKEVDVIIGGPPCQAYSIAGRAQDKNSMKYDYRNYLFESFLEVVDYFKPKVFVFENVPGMLSAKPGEELVIDRIYREFSNIGYNIRRPSDMDKSVYSTSDFGVPQKRRRVIIFGVRDGCDQDVESYYNALNSKKSKKIVTVRDTIGNFPKLIPLESPIKENGKNISHYNIDNRYLDSHFARYHNLRDIEIFREWINKSMNELSVDKKLDFYYKMTGKRTNHNKYRNLEWDKPSPTIVAHLSKDGLMFIHPDIEQARSLTIREAATLQTFPLDFEFVGSISEKFKMIGNAVPVGFAKMIALAVDDVLGEKVKVQNE